MLMTERQLRKVIRKVIKESIDPFSLGLPTAQPDVNPEDYYDEHIAKFEKVAKAYKEQDWSEVDPLGGHFRTVKPDESMEDYYKEASKHLDDVVDNAKMYAKLANVLLDDPSAKEKEAALKVFGMGAMPDPLMGDKGTVGPDGKPFDESENPLASLFTSTVKPGDDPFSGDQETAKPDGSMLTDEDMKALHDRVETLENHQDDVDKIIKQFREKLK